MRLRAFCKFLGCSALVLIAGIAFGRPTETKYHLLKKYPFGPAEGATREYFDYINVDSAARRVYLSRGTEVSVISADTGEVIGNIAGLKLDHGVALAKEFNRGFITDGGRGKVAMFDLKTLKITGEVDAAPDADSIVYDPVSKRVFSMNGDSKSSTVIDAKTGKVLKTIDLGSGPEFCVADGKGMVYVNIEATGEIVGIDTRTLTIKSRWPLKPAGGGLSALAMDREHRRLFSSGRMPATLMVVNADTGKVIQSFPISDGVDANAYEPSTGLIFVSTRAGKLHIFHEDSPDKFSEMQTVDTEVGAKTLGLDTKTHRVFVDTSDFETPAPTQERPHPRPVGKVGTFRVLVYAP